MHITTFLFKSLKRIQTKISLVFFKDGKKPGFCMDTKSSMKAGYYQKIKTLFL